MKALKPFVDFADRLTERLGFLGQLLVPLLVLIGFANVVLRYVGQVIEVKLTNNAIIETQWYLYTLIFFFGFSYLLKHDLNVRVDFWFAEQEAKRKAWIDFIGHSIALLPFCVLALYVTFNPVLTSWGHKTSAGIFEGWDQWEGTAGRLTDYRIKCHEDPECGLLSFESWQRRSNILPWEVSPDADGLPRAPIKSMIIIAFAVLLIQSVAEYIKLIAILRGDETFKRIELNAPIRIE
ncbi:MAG: TRAP-type mannitol/chloroaromatic compound transport system permease small subunit [Cellvibrionaceae bacterium]|jgi:TRAP-type mannitol/chloroaromatic compound transport system permease small subunit